MLLTIIFGIAIRHVFPSGWIWLIIKLSMIVCIYGAAMLAYGMTKYEKELVLSILRKLRIIGGR